MKNKTLLLGIMTVLLVGGCHDRREPDDIYVVDELPTYVFQMPVCETLLPNILKLFPEHKNNMEKYQLLFREGFQQQIILKKDAEIFVTFVGEAASRNNVLGWYAYNELSAPSADVDLKNQIVFPHISNSILKPGYSRSLGKFEAGTIIGFYLIVGGWDSENHAIDFKKPILYSDAVLNKNGVKQSVLFDEAGCNDIVVGFEDTSLSNADRDFNDILIKISDNDQNEVSASFDKLLIPVL